MTLNSEAGRRLHDELTARFGPIEDGHGRKVYGHKCITAAWRAGVLADLRGDSVVRTTREPQKQAGDSGSECVERTIPPSATRASRMARVACLAVLAVGALATIGVEGNLFGLIASLPAPKLFAAAMGRKAA